MGTLITKDFHENLANYFASKPLYLDEPTQKKPNTRKLVEQPWQLIKVKSWNELKESLTCEDFFIELANFDKSSFVNCWNKIQLHLEYSLPEIFRSVIDCPFGKKDKFLIELSNLLKEFEFRKDYYLFLNNYTEKNRQEENRKINNDISLKIQDQLFQAEILLLDKKYNEALEVIDKKIIYFKSFVDSSFQRIPVDYSFATDLQYYLRIKGEILIAAERYPEATEVYKELIELAKTFKSFDGIVLTLTDLASLEHQMGNAKQANEFLDEAFKLAYTGAYRLGLSQALLVRSFLLKDEDKFEEAIASCKESEIEANKNSEIGMVLKSQYYQARLNYEKGHISEGIKNCEDFEKCCFTLPQNELLISVYEIHAGLLLIQKRYDESLEIINQIEKMKGGI